MFCEKCGGELRQEENKLVCTKCGAESDVQTPSAELVVPRGFSSKKLIVIIIVAAILMIGGVSAIVAVNVTKPSSQSALTDIQIAERYLSEKNYEQAIIEFEKILEIEPMNVEAYLGLADAYIGKGDTDKALEILRKGLEQTGDARIQAKIDELTKPAESPSSSTSSTPSVTNAYVYDDAECLAIEEMIEAYLRGEGEINTSMLQNVTSLKIYGTELVAVKCDNRIGTESRGWSTDSEKITVRTRNRDEKISYGSIDNINEDIPFIFDIPFLKELTIDFNKICDISSLARLTNLTYLDLYNNQISDISALSGLTNLTVLDLAWNQISDISSLSGLTNLTSLDLWNNQISDITPLARLTNMTWLGLGSNQISDISALSGLTNLVWLILDSNQISDISVLSGLTNLTYLYLYENQISDISALSGLTNLTDLWLSHNEISDISALAGLTNLTHLSLWSNQISDADQAWLKEKLPTCKIDF